MADMICRWRNGTPKTVVELTNALPHERMKSSVFREKMERIWPDFFHTAYQLACQLALYVESEDGFYYPRFDKDINESEAEEYLRFWITRYYIPNPYVGKNGFADLKCPTFVLKSLCDYVSVHPNCEYKDAYHDCFGEFAKNNDDIVRNYINNFSEVLEFSKDGKLNLLNGNYSGKFCFMNRNDKKSFFENFNNVSNPDQRENNVFSPSQIIYYGVPGCGKSHQVKEDLKAKGIPQDRTKRVVFHPDYCNADFVGQIMPETKSGGGIRYNFKAGPFAKILREAYENPKLEYALIIEEINRGNAAAIFGDIFQLLDRKTRQEQTENLNGNTYGIGWSDYCVNNDYINAYFRGAYDGEIVDGSLPEKKLGNTTFNDNVDIRLPPNLSIYATMNTSDQNVFTLDNAFQRRWKMKQISNTLNCSDPKEAAQYNLTIGNSNVKWGKFREEINNKIVDPDYTSNFSSLEDKRLGGWFVVPEKEGDTFISKENFADKVIKFLWDDAFKFNRAIFGDYEKKSLELVIEAFVGDVGFGVFEENFRKCLNVAESSADQQSDGQS